MHHHLIFTNYSFVFAQVLMESDYSGLDLGQQEGWFTIHLVCWEWAECVTSVLLHTTNASWLLHLCQRSSSRFTTSPFVRMMKFRWVSIWIGWQVSQSERLNVLLLLSQVVRVRCKTQQDIKVIQLPEEVYGLHRRDLEREGQWSYSPCQHSLLKGEFLCLMCFYDP